MQRQQKFGNWWVIMNWAIDQGIRKLWGHDGDFTPRTGCARAVAANENWTRRVDFSLTSGSPMNALVSPTASKNWPR